MGYTGIPVGDRFEVSPFETGLDQQEIDKPQHECGVAAVYAPGESTGFMAYTMLLALQNRGQQAAGIVVADTVNHYPGHTGDSLPLMVHKNIGKVREAIGREVSPMAEEVEVDGRMVRRWTSRLDKMYPSPVAIVQNRYSTTAGKSWRDAQPEIGDDFAFAFNGHYEAIDDLRLAYGMPPMEGTDGAKFTDLVSRRKEQLGGDLLATLQDVLPDVRAAFCMVLTDGKRIYAARDQWAMHPFALGRTPNGGYVLASEQAAFLRIGATVERDVEPGELIVIGEDGLQSFRFADAATPRRECFMEYGYFAQRNSTINGVDVYQARMNMGRELWASETNPIAADGVIGVPDSGMAAAFGFSRASGIPIVEGLFKNSDADRTFIDGADTRLISVDGKYEVNVGEVDGRVFYVVDDSVVRGHTQDRIVHLLKAAGAKEVHVRSAAPPIQKPCFMGLDMSDPDTLVANRLSPEELAHEIDADSLRYNTMEAVERSVRDAAVDKRVRRPLGRLCTACVTGNYPFPIRSQPVTLGMPVVRQSVELVAQSA